jgi:DtxR family Mn-dependent transcriptional regulator
LGRKRGLGYPKNLFSFAFVFSQPEENYLKAIFSIREKTGAPVQTSDIAERLGTSAASVTEMIKRLADKGLVSHEKYHGADLTKEGDRVARQLVRKHRLWETFLVEKLKFTWDEVHEAAEELEHVHSKLLTDRLDDFLGNPKYDPHGDPIPDKSGRMTHRNERTVRDLQQGESGVVVGVKDSSDDFLRFLDAQGIHIGASLRVKKVFEFDNGREVTVNRRKSATLSGQASEKLYVQ